MVNAPSYDTYDEPVQSLVPLRRSRESAQDLSVDTTRRPAPLEQYNEMLASFLTNQQLEQARLVRQMGGEASATLQPPFTQQYRQAQPGPPLTPYQYHPQYYHQPPPQQQQQPVRRSEPHHRVYVLRCSHCEAFLCDRGMRAVLLLKPHITLFSTDTAPVNCGPLYAGNGEGRDEPEEVVERTCECLTQSLGCFNCGNINGYHIVAPCTRCTASVTKHQRPANGHRYVFHHNEVVYEERKYYPGEPGVRTDLVRRSARAPEISTPLQSPLPTPFIENKDLREQPTTPFTSTSLSPPSPPAPIQPKRKGLQEGDTVYWHYLISFGEVSKAVDPRSRVPTAYSIGR